MDQILVVGFSPWGEWSACKGDCGSHFVGRSTRERTCEADITDDLSCIGPTKQVQSCELDCSVAARNIIQSSLQCDSKQFPTSVMSKEFPCKYHFLGDPYKNWNEAQAICGKEFRGKLWEPVTAAEFEAVINAAESQANTILGGCWWWLGLFNWNDGTPDSVDAYLSSTVITPPTLPPNHGEPSPRNGVISNFITVNDGNDGGSQNCVHTTLNWLGWQDLPCTYSLPFICQECPPPCSCSFNGVSYPCGSTIERDPHCCSNLICNLEGIIVKDQIKGKNGKPEAGCCIWRGRMITDGTEFGPFWARRVCCRGEILLKYTRIFTFAFPTKPVGSVLAISEGGNTVVQENIFTEATGMLEIKVPSHKNYTDSVFLLHQASKTSMLKTNNTCQLSTLPSYVNVSVMAGEFESLEAENSTVTDAKTITTFVLKGRQSRLGIRRRENLLPEIQDRCKKEPLIETNDFIINATQFEKYNAGELIVIDNEKKTRLCETHYDVCSKEGPTACGYGWTNPDQNAPVAGFTFHQVSDGSICVSCNIELPGPPPCPDNGFCECKEIKNKEDLMDCVLDSDTDTDIEEDGEIFTQRLTYNSETNARSVTITSPAHKDLQTLEVVMHARSDGYWHASNLKNNHLMKLGDTCHISTLPSNVFPVDIALGIQEIKKGNNVTVKEDEVETQGIILGRGSLSKSEENSLHPDIKSRCVNSKIDRFEEVSVTRDQADDLKNGKIILIGSKLTKSNCVLLTAATRRYNETYGCWRWPNPGSDGGQVFIHHIVTSVLDVTCCENLPGFPNCCEELYPQYCECNDITQQNFNQCKAPLRTAISAEDVLENGTKIQVSQIFNYNRDNGGSLRIDVEAHKDYKNQSLIFNETTMVFKRGDVPCTVINFKSHKPLQVALDAAEIKKEISLEDQTRQDVVFVTSDTIPIVSGDLNVCQNYIAGTMLYISSDQYSTLESGNIIFVEDQITTTSVRELLPTPRCTLQTACAYNNGSGCYRFPAPQGETIYVHGVVSSPVCLQCCADGSDSNFCSCSDITDKKSFEFCLGPRPKTLFVATGVDDNSESFGSVEILAKNQFGTYWSKSVDDGGCFSNSADFPFLTSSATGAVFNGLVHVCVGYTDGETSSECFGFNNNGSWNYSFVLKKQLSQGGTSVTFGSKEEGNKQWWIVGGDPNGNSTELWGGEPPAEMSNGNFDLPLIINTPCMTAISEDEAFVSAIPKFESARSNFAWTFNKNEGDSWTRLPNTIEKHSGPACGFLQTSQGRFIVLAGGYKSSSTEILNLDTKEWSMGPDIGIDLYGGSMVSLRDDEELLLVGGFSTEAQNTILRMNSSMESWEPVGSLTNARYNAVALAVPVNNLPPLFDPACV